MFCLYETELPRSTKIDYEKIGNRGKGIRQEKCQLGLILCQSDKLTQWKTRIHSSRMRTARSFPYGGICPGGVSVRGCLYPVWGVSVQEGSLSRRGLCPGGGVSIQESLSRGLCPGVSVHGDLCPGTSVCGRLYQGDPLPLWTDKHL